MTFTAIVKETNMITLEKKNLNISSEETLCFLNQTKHYPIVPTDFYSYEKCIFWLHI